MDKHYTWIRIVIADDHEIFRDGFISLVEKLPGIELLADASNGKELISLVEKYNPDVVLTDIKMPHLDGIAATKLIIKKFPHIGIIALSMFDDDNLIVEMLEAGAKGYLVKNAHKSEIAEAIRTVYKQETYFCNSTKYKLAQMIAESRFNPHRISKRPDFSPKEMEIIKLICKQLSNKEISNAIHLSIRTVEGYREKILKKMQVRNTAGIVVYAIKNQLYIP